MTTQIPSSRYENDLRQEGFDLIAGVDEAGCGPMAGPVVAAAVILPKKFNLIGLRDSKKLTLKQREYLFPLILDQALAIGVGEISHILVDRLNIHNAALLAMKAAVLNLHFEAKYLLIDGRHTIPGIPIPQLALVRGESKSCSIAAASVVAKVTRDRIMRYFDGFYPGYDFKIHKGYGTRRHRQLLEALGPSPIHRKTFNFAQ